MILPYSKPKTPIAFVVAGIAIEIIIIIAYGVFGNVVMNDSNLWGQMATQPSKFYYFFLMNLNNIFFGLVLLAGKHLMT